MESLYLKALIFGFSISLIVTSVYVLLWWFVVKVKNAYVRARDPWYLLKEYKEK